ncbi:MAG: hypothetical protein ACLFPX_08540 [Candidatus Omnitrophota bacterium]
MNERLMEQSERGSLNAATADQIREQITEYCKEFKTSWVKLGQTLYPVWKDKLFYAWGFDKFEYYTKEELGLKKSTALKLLKTYFFIEQNEPNYLHKEFSQEREAAKVPGCEEVNVLRLARGKKELNKDDYRQLREAAFQKGTDASGLRKDLTAMMKEREEIDPDEERERRNQQAIRRLANALLTFSKDMETLKLADPELVAEAKDLLGKLQGQVD